MYNHPSAVPCGFLPTPSARRATGIREHALPDGGISTHALREEGDRWTGSGRAKK